MKYTLWAVLALLAIVANSHAAEIRLSLGVRETNAAGPVGSNGGSANGIEWVGRDTTTGLDLTLVPADNAWHEVRFNIANPVVGFAGSTADGNLASTSGFGTLEHLRVANTADGFTRYRIWIDDLVNIVNDVATTITDFESYSVGDEVIFQEPRFSGSTSGKLQASPNLAGVTDAIAFGGTKSYGFDFEFIDDTAAGAGGSGNWARLTSSNTSNLPNVAIGVPGGPTNTSIVSMQVRVEAVPEPASLLLGVMGCVALLGFVRR